MKTDKGKRMLLLLVSALFITPASAQDWRIDSPGRSIWLRLGARQGKPLESGGGCWFGIGNHTLYQIQLLWQMRHRH